MFPLGIAEGRLREHKTHRCNGQQHLPSHGLHSHHEPPVLYDMAMFRFEGEPWHD